MPGPTIVLVHGAFADASGFAGVIRELESADHTVETWGRGAARRWMMLAPRACTHF